MFLESTASGAGGSLVIIVFYVAFFAIMMYFLVIRPQKKQQNKMNELYSSLEVGDSILTTSGFYGTLLAIEGDTVIVEFGNNKNCRIPMQKAAIAQVEKANSPQPEEIDDEKVKLKK